MENHHDTGSRERTPTHRRELRRRRPRPRPDPRVEQAARRPLALRPVHRQRRRQTSPAGPVARPEAPGGGEHQALQATHRPGNQAERLLTSCRREPGPREPGYYRDKVTVYYTEER